MVKINNASGKKMQIRFSKIYIYQGNKQDLDSDISIETQINNLADCVRNLASVAEVDSNKLELYTLMYGLGKIEYGKKGLQYINQILPSDVAQITEAEIVYNNLTKIFKDVNKDIGVDTFKEFCATYEQAAPNEPIDIQILRLAIMLEAISMGVTKSVLSSGGEDYLAGTKLKIEEMRQIKELYKREKRLELSPKTKALLSKIEKLYVNYELTESQKEELERLVEDAVQNSKSRVELLDVIYSFSSANKKKIRGK